MVNSPSFNESLTSIYSIKCVPLNSKLEAVNYYHKMLHPGCYSSPRSFSGDKTDVWNVSTLPLLNNQRIIRIRVRNHILLVTDFLCSFPEVLSLKHFLYLRILVISYKDWPVLIQFLATAYQSCFWQNFTNWMYLGNRKLWNGVISQKLSRCCCWWLQKHLAVVKFT